MFFLLVQGSLIKIKQHRKNITHMQWFSLLKNCSLYTCFVFKKNICIVLLTSIVLFASYFNLKQIKEHPSQVKTIFSVKKELDSQITGNINIFRYQDSNMIAMPIFYLFYYQNRVNDKGQSFGFCDNNRFTCPSGQFISKSNYFVYKLDDLKNKSNFNQLTSQNIYQILMVNYGN